MNPEYFAQEVAAQAMQAKHEHDYTQLQNTVVVAAKLGKATVKVTSRYPYPQAVIKALEDNGIVYMEDETAEDGGITTTFDISKLGAIK